MALGRDGFEALVRARSRPLEDELAIRAARVEELRRGVVWTRPATPPAAPPPRSTTPPAWSASRPPTPTTKTKYPWSIVLKTEALRPFEIALQGDVSWRILREVRDVSGEDIETGGHLWGRERARTRSADIVYATGAGVPGQLTGVAA